MLKELQSMLFLIIQIAQPRLWHTSYVVQHIFHIDSLNYDHIGQTNDSIAGCSVIHNEKYAARLMPYM